MPILKGVELCAVVNRIVKENDQLKKENEQLKKENYELHEQLGDFEPFEWI